MEAKTFFSFVGGGGRGFRGGKRRPNYSAKGVRRGGEEHGREEFDELFENKNEIGEELKGENCDRQNNKKIWQIPY